MAHDQEEEEGTGTKTRGAAGTRKGNTMPTEKDDPYAIPHTLALSQMGEAALPRGVELHDLRLDDGVGDGAGDPEFWGSAFDRSNALHSRTGNSSR